MNAVLIRDSPGEDQDAVNARIKRVFSSVPEYRYVSVIGKHFTLDPVAEDIRALPSLLNIISVFIVVVALPLIELIAAMVAHERQREIGLLKAMGAKTKTIFFLVIAESLVLAASGGIAGVGLSLVALFLMDAQVYLTALSRSHSGCPPPSRSVRWQVLHCLLSSLSGVSHHSGQHTDAV